MTAIKKRTPNGVRFCFTGGGSVAHGKRVGFDRPKCMSFTTLAGTALCVLFLAGCLDPELGPIVPCTTSRFEAQARVNAPENIDLLFVVDDSPSMVDEQEKLRRELPRLVEILSTGDLQAGQPEMTGFGEQDFQAPKSIRVGVITPNLGSGSLNVCPDSDDGHLIFEPSNTSPDGCSAWPTSYLEYRPQDVSEAEAARFATDVGCVATTGTEGCGFEQPLEALLKALTPAERTVSPPFSAPTQGQGTFNAFVRPDSLLVVIMVGDEEDCSTPNEEVFRVPLELPGFEGANTLNYRCVAFADQLFNVRRYVEGMLTLRPDPNNLVFAAIAGIPEDLAGDDFARMLADPRMNYAPQSVSLNGQESVIPRAACTSTASDGSVQSADPARRIVEFAQGLSADNERGSASATVQSICSSDFGPALDAVAEIISVQFSKCFARPLPLDHERRVRCQVIETLPLGKTCDAALGREFREVTGEGQHVCLVSQQRAPQSIADIDTGLCTPETCGWYYDTVSDLAGQCADKGLGVLAFAEGAYPQNEARFRVECLQNTFSADGDAKRHSAGEPCSAMGQRCEAHCEGRTTNCICDETDLICDAERASWERACNTHADCRGGYFCDAQRQASDGTILPPICVNPTCSGPK